MIQLRIKCVTLAALKMTPEGTQEEAWSRN